MPRGKRKLEPDAARSLRRALLAEVPHRVELLREELEARRLDALLVTSEANVHYLSGFTGSESALLVGRRSTCLVTDARFGEEAGRISPDLRVVVRKRYLLEECVRQAQRRGWLRLGFEMDAMLAVDLELLKRHARAQRRRRVKPVGTTGLVAALRATKSAAEVEALRTAVRIAERAGGETRRFFREGRSELELARRVARRMEDLGASRASFETIAALDARASLPHAHPGEARAGRRSVLLLDWGARYLGYCSDLTRLFALASIPAWLGKAHEAVLEAQRAAITRVGPGVRARDVDAAARKVLRRQGLAHRFGHGVGHGLGLDVHEGPRLGPRSRDVLRPGMVVTIEPGVYFPGRGGVRVEDDVVVTEGGAEVLGRLRRGLARPS
jgi:Xaa-Pro aminopeptidase